MTIGHGDRFVPSHDVEDMRAASHLLDKYRTATPSKHRTVPAESDAERQGNAVVESVLRRGHTAVCSSSRSQSAINAPSPLASALELSTMSNCNLPFRSSPDDAWIRWSTRPWRAGVGSYVACARYRVLDAPEPADDFGRVRMCSVWG